MNLLYNYLKPYRSLLMLALFLAAANQSFSMMDPYISQLIIDQYLLKAKSLPSDVFLAGVIKLLLCSVGVAFMSRVAKNFQDYFTNVIIQRLGADIYSDGIKHSLAVSYEEFEDQRSGETLGVLQKVRQDTEKLIQAVISVLFTTFIGIVFVSYVAIQVNWLILPVFISVIPILGLLSSLLSKRIKKMQKLIVSETTQLAGSTTESLRNIELVKSLGLTSQEINRLNTTTTKILGLELKKVRYIRSLSFIQGTSVNLLRTAVMFVMMYLIFKDQISVGQYFMMMFYSFFIFGPIQELGNVINVYREAEVSLANFQKILDTPIEPKAESPQALNEIQKLTFNQVKFAYQSSNRPSLNEISFEVKKGETIAFVGPSGSGKTTLVKLLVGLYRPKEGDILYNDISSKNIQLDELREQIGFVTQDTQLFSGSIKENLLFVKPDASDEEINSVLQKASCQNLLARADKGIDTIIGEGGVKVSGGEKQRLSIARALLRNPRLLVFDEATSALDSITEEEISQTIREVTSKRDHITILIAHRLSTIMHADRIYVLELGKVIESGKHQDLIDEKGLYYAMWRQQIGEGKIVKTI
ncbi:MAG: ABC transporter ATP-binding protein [Bacteroidia bacterium]